MTGTDTYAKTALATAIGLSAIAIAYVYRFEIKRSIKKIFKGYSWFEDRLEWYRNSTLRSGVESLHPDFRDEVKEFFSWMEKETDWYPVWSSGVRSFEKQKHLHSINSKNPTAGGSKHNYGLAFDINIKNRRTGQQLYKADSKYKWLSSGIPQQAEKMGFVWGGRFKGYNDPIHFSKKATPEMDVLLARYESGKKDKQGFVFI